MNSKIMAAALFAAFGITSAYAAPQYGDTPSATRGAVRDLITESDSVNVTFKNGVTQQRGVLTISKYMHQPRQTVIRETGFRRIQLGADHVFCRAAHFINKLHRLHVRFRLLMIGGCHFISSSALIPDTPQRNQLTKMSEVL